MNDLIVAVFNCKVLCIRLEACKIFVASCKTSSISLVPGIFYMQHLSVCDKAAAFESLEL